MKTWSLNKVKVNKLSLALVAFLCGTIILWAWERPPFTSTYLPTVEHIEVIVPEPVIVAGGSVHGAHQKQSVGKDLLERTQKPSYEENNSIPQADSLIDGSEQNIGDANSAHQKQSAGDALLERTQKHSYEENNSTIPQVDSINSSERAQTANVVYQKQSTNQTSTERVQTLSSEVENFASPQINSSYNSSEKKTRDVDLQEVPAVKKDCNFAKGKWVEDERRPLYSGMGCKQWLSEMWACRLMKRIDFSYESFRWQPQGCNMPDFSGHEFLRRMKDKTIAFVGDSLGRQQFQSLMCMVTAGKPYHEVEDVGKEYRLVKARGAIRPDGWAYRFTKTNTTILYYWSASLCELEPLSKSDPATTYAMHLDRPATFLKQYLDRFDVLVLNTGHHWNRYKFKANRWEMYVGGKPNTDRKTADLGSAKNLTISSVVRWLDSQLPHHPRLKAFFRTISPRHFVNGEWNTGGSCDSSVPLARGSEVLLDRSKDSVAESAVRGTRVKLLDITAISELRDESHISKYSAKSANGAYDCLHWCLPGIPDTWNELLYAQIL